MAKIKPIKAVQCALHGWMVRGYAVVVLREGKNPITYPCETPLANCPHFTGEQAIQLMEELAGRGFVTVAITDIYGSKELEELSMEEMKSIYEDWKTYPKYRP